MNTRSRAAALLALPSILCAGEALSRGRGWSSRAQAGRKALIGLAPELDVAALWKK